LETVEGYVEEEFYGGEEVYYKAPHLSRGIHDGSLWHQMK
jgi:hypothetical protein